MEPREQPPDAECESSDSTARPAEGFRTAIRSQRPFLLLFVMALGLTIFVMWPFRDLLLLAAVLASVLQRTFVRLCRLCRGRRWAGALLTTLGLVVVLLGPLATVGALAAQQIIRGLAFVHDQLGIHTVAQLKQGSLPSAGQHVADQIRGVLHLTTTQIENLTGRAASWAEDAFQGVVASSSKALFHTGVLIVAFYFLLVEGPRLVRWLRRVSPLQKEETQELLDEFRDVARATILGAAISALFQGVTASLGFFITGVPHAIFFGLLTLLGSLIPVFGTLLVWVPAVLLLWTFGHHTAAVALTVWCVVLVGGVEQVGKPLVLRRILHTREPMHTGLIFLSLLGGIQMFGPIGIVLGPLIVALFLAMSRLYERRLKARESLIH